jgi:hypothetical protein
MMSVCAAPPTRETEMPAFMAGRMPELNRSVSRKICPSVIEITFVGTNAVTSPACVSMIGRPVSEPVLPLRRAPADHLDVLALTRALRSSRRGADRTRRRGRPRGRGGRRSGGEICR